MNINATAYADANEIKRTKNETGKTLDDIKKEQSRFGDFVIEISQAFMGIFLGTVGFVLSLYSALYFLELLAMISPVLPMVLSVGMLLVAAIIYFK